MPFASRLIHTCTIQVNTPTQHSSGAETENWSDESTDVPCRLIDGRGFKPMENVGRQVQFDKILLLNNDATMSIGRRVKDVQDADGNTVDAGPFETINVSKRYRKGPSAHHIAVELRRVS